MNLFTKTGPWVIASLLATTAIFGQSSRCPPSQRSFDQGHEMMQNQMMPGYNAPARIDVRGSWDIYAQASFTYWQPIQDNMEMGIVDDSSNPIHFLFGNVVNCNFEYKPGFKVGLGANFEHDDWDTLVQYTWFRGAMSTHTSLDSVGSPLVTLHPMTVAPVAHQFYEGTQKWRLRMDIIDWELARSYYVGTKLSFRSFFATRAQWIRQNRKNSFLREDSDTTQNFTVRDRSYSWAVGPRAGLYSNWMIGDGFRLYGNGAGDILFTQYRDLRHFEQLTTANVPTTNGTIPKKAPKNNPKKAL